jgi:glyoxylase-like metal-dependent hydrolase (beta-lactamase superfamily II)
VSPNLRIQSFFHEPTSTVSHLIWDAGARRAAVIDAVLDFDSKSGRIGTHSVQTILDAIKDQALVLDWIFETHAHADHLSGAPFLKAATGAPIAIGEHITQVQRTFKNIFNLMELIPDGRPFDRLLKDGELLPLGALSIKVMNTPGHTLACVSYLIEDAVFVGDTMFMPDYGTARCDFPGGDARSLYLSVKRLLALRPETHVFLCHDYRAPGRTEFKRESTIAEQRARNVHVHDGVSEEEFVAMRLARDKMLEAPVLLLPSVQVNIVAGELPKPEDNGIRYLKLPLNAFGAD